MAEHKDDTPDDQPFLSRWSERKRAVEHDLERASPDTGSEPIEGADSGVTDEELAANREAAEAIDIDSLNKDSDYTPYLKDGVPPTLKSAALQKLWRSSPIFANIDGLNDYDEDFTIPKTPIGAIKTAWKFGRGFLTDDDLADKSEIAPDPQTDDPGGGGDETVAEADTSAADAEIEDDTESDADPVSPDTDPAETGPENIGIAKTGPPGADLADATGENPEPGPAPRVGLRDRLDMAAFSGADED